MKKTYLFIPIVTLAFLAGAPVFAETNSDESLDTSVTASGDRDTYKNIRTRMDLREEAKDMRKDIMDKRSDRMDSIKENYEEIDGMRADLKAEIDALRIQLDAVTTVEAKAAIKAQIEAKLQSARADMKSARTENHANIKAKTADIRELRATAISKVFNAAIGRLDKISLRVSTRIDKLSLLGKDVTSAKASLVSAQGHIAEAKTAFAALPQISTRASLDGRANAMLSVKMHLKEAHADLSASVAALKAIK